MNIDTDLTVAIARQHRLDLAADVRAHRRTGFWARRHNAALPRERLASVVELAPPRAGPDGAGRDRHVA